MRSVDKQTEVKFLQFINEARKVLLEDTKPSEEAMIKAVNDRRYIGIYYDGDESVLSGFRCIEPFAVFRGYKTWKSHTNKKGSKVSQVEVVNKDRLYLRAYVVLDTSKDQATRGKFKVKRKSVSKTGRKEGWRMFRIDRITDFSDLGKTFSSYRKKYNPDDKNAVELLASLPIDKFPKGEI